jgi:hypothetical protein
MKSESTQKTWKKREEGRVRGSREFERERTDRGEGRQRGGGDGESKDLYRIDRERTWFERQ